MSGTLYVLGLGVRQVVVESDLAGVINGEPLDVTSNETFAEGIFFDPQSRNLFLTGGTNELDVYSLIPPTPAPISPIPGPSPGFPTMQTPQPTQTNGSPNAGQPTPPAGKATITPTKFGMIATTLIIAFTSLYVLG